MEKYKPEKKKCSKCNQLKPLSEYSPCKTGKWGVYNYCNDCHAKYQKDKFPYQSNISEKTLRRRGLRKQGLKTCSSCKKIKPLSEFYDDLRRKTDGKQSHCKECILQKQNAHYLMKEYGITIDEYTLLLDAQNGVCAICGRPPKKFRFNIDHDHKTHKIRALLCVNCNTNLLPYVERFPVWVRQAFDYLENPPAFAIIGEKLVPETNQSRKKKRASH